MMNFLNTKFDNIGKETFIKIAAISCLLADFLLVVYIHMHWFKERFTIEFLKGVLKFNGLQIAHIEDIAILDYKYLLTSSLSNVLVFFLGIHGVIYFLFLKQVNWTKKYVGGYCLTTTLLTILELIIFREYLNKWSLILVFTSFTYFLVFKGIKHLKIQEQ